MQPDQNPAQPTPQAQPAPAVPPTPVATTPPTPPPSPAAPAQAGSAPSGYESNPFKLLKPSWEAIKLNLTTYLVSFVAATVLMFLAAAVPALLIGFVSANNKINASGPFLVGAVLIGFIISALLIVRFMGLGVYLSVKSIRGAKTSFKEAWAGGKPYGWKVTGFAILYSILVTIGFVLFIVPGILAIAWFSLAPYLIVEENLGIVAAMKRSKQLVKGRFWDALGVALAPTFFIALFIIPILGWIAGYALMVAYSLAPAIRYAQLKEFKDSAKPFPAVSPANYAVVGVWVLLTVVSTVFSVVGGLNGVQNGSGDPYMMDTKLNSDESLPADDGTSSPDAQNESDNFSY